MPQEQISTYSLKHCANVPVAWTAFEFGPLAHWGSPGFSHKCFSSSLEAASELSCLTGALPLSLFLLLRSQLEHHVPCETFLVQQTLTSAPM